MDPHSEVHAMDPWRSVKGQYPAEDMPEYPARVLIEHCAWKGVQWSVLALPAWPIYSLLKRKPLAATYRRAFIAIPLAGSILTFAMLGYKAVFQMDAAGVDDRAYRISKSEGQNQVDNLSLRGALIGATLGAIGGAHGFSSVAATASLGIALAVAAHGAKLGMAEAEKRNYQLPDMKLDLPSKLPFDIKLPELPKLK